ncbi:hypothetical protein [Peribacillus sp. Bi134]|uniref:hypothetical protein n=1 Tax=Peribacillus sp. Bi134 TaxID=2884272 RepID=UPI001DF47E98|nr:hypothetical protein [Peribacillus sp. Bi134]CAH0198663.1 Low-affinity putrescine importer PlaP [Peribacillus sp. Bi134]
MSNLSKTDRILTLIPVVLFGFSFMGLTTAFTTYGIAANISHGTVPGAMIVALVVMMFTAYSYGKMAIAFPSSGSAYVYTQKSLNPSVGFLVGWVILMDYLFIYAHGELFSIWYFFLSSLSYNSKLHLDFRYADSRHFY